MFIHPLPDIWAALKAAILPTFRDIIRSPSLLLSPTEISRLFMAHVWVIFADNVDQAAKSTKQALIPQNAYGVVLDIGAG